MTTMQEIRDLIIERGLAHCRRQLAEGDGPCGFYSGAINGFEECRKYSSFEELEARIAELTEDEGKRFLQMGSAPTEKELYEWWYWRGYSCQLEFLQERLVLLQGKPRIVSARALLDLREILNGEAGGESSAS